MAVPKTNWINWILFSPFAMQRFRARLVSSDADDKKRYSLSFGSYVRRSEHAHRPPPPSESDRRLSDSGPRPNVEDGNEEEIKDAEDESLEGPKLGAPNFSRHGSGINGVSVSSSSENTPSARRNRFSMLRFRHASDPQLSVTYSQGNKNVPPVPHVPPCRF